MDVTPISKKFLQAKPNAYSVKFGGAYLNLREIARRLECDHGHLSRVFNSRRGPSLQMAQRLAEALGMSVDDFLTALRARKNRTKLQ